VSEEHTRNLVAEAVEWQKQGVQKLPGSAVSAAPRVVADSKMSKNKKKKIKKKKKKQVELLNKQIAQLEELEQPGILPFPFFVPLRSFHPPPPRVPPALGSFEELAQLGILHTLKACILLSSFHLPSFLSWVA